MRNIVILFVIYLFSCAGSKELHTQVQANEKLRGNDTLYTIYKIDSINNYYLVYAKKKDSLFKIVSKKTEKDCDGKISLNSSYNLKLFSVWNQDVFVNGVNVSPRFTPHVTCIGYDKDTYICIERDSINDLHHTNSLEGLCLSKL